MAAVSNRRNFYRLLQVQPDAAPEVIKAAYRALMALHHPDKGGESTTAALITNAYATVSDPVLRTAYDAARQARSARSFESSANRMNPWPSSAPFSRAASASASAPPNPVAAPNDSCPFCAVSLTARARRLSRCPRCQVPLVAVQSGGTPLTKERRRMMRVSKSDWALLHTAWNADGLDVRMRDLSLDDISVYCGSAVPFRRRVRVVGAMFDVMGEIVSARRVGNVYTLHAHLLTAIFAQPAGGFVSTSA